MFRIALVVALVLLIVVPAAHAAPWRPPVARLEVLRPFGFDPAVPYAAGAQRGVLLAARPGAAVRAVCAGRVRFAGRVPGLGAGVTVRCGALLATQFGLAAPLVRRGALVRRGDRLGLADGGGRVRLGARRAGARHGYLDPLALLGRDATPSGPVPAPRRGRRPVPPPAAPAPAADALGAPRPPIGAWAGALAACVALGLGRRGARTRARARRRTARGTVRANH